MWTQPETSAAHVKKMFWCNCQSNAVRTGPGWREKKMRRLTIYNLIFQQHFFALSSRRFYDCTDKYHPPGNCSTIHHTTVICTAWHSRQFIISYDIKYKYYYSINVSAGSSSDWLHQASNKHGTSAARHVCNYYTHVMKPHREYDSGTYIHIYIYLYVYRYIYICIFFHMNVLYTLKQVCVYGQI